jgi:DNA-binding NtrC family response regulator
MSNENFHLMIVDDQESIRKLCVTVGTSLGLRCTQAESAEAALARLETEAPDMVLADLMMPNMSGLDFLTEAKRKLVHAEIAIMTGHGSIETAVQAMRLGAYD